ncbi:MAG: ferritin-like domain-containing protein [Chloroflexia bacterium]|nr:ferritin-like domain-containing protein [Chloroflexia bacterium]
MTSNGRTAEFATARRRSFQESGCESVQDILNIAATAEAFAVTALGGALESAADGTLALSEEAIQSLQAARAAEQAHYEFLIDNGAEPLTTTFTIPDEALLTDPATFLTTLITLEEAFIAAYIAAAQQFVAQGEDKLARVALQIGAVEAEHRAGVRFFAIEAGVIEGVPNDVAFEQALYGSVSEAAAALEELGFIDGEGTEVEYPGPGEIDMELVRNREP